MTESRTNIKRLSESEFQRKCSTFVSSEILLRATPLVDTLIGWGDKPFSYDDIINRYDEDVDDVDDMRPKEIYEWWFVSRWLYDLLKKQGEPVLTDDFYHLWGRTTTGQAIAIDHCIRQIVKEVYGIEVSKDV